MIIKNPKIGGKRVVCNCQNCNVEFSALISRVKIGREKFCSNTCYNKFRLINKQDEKLLNRLHQKKHKYGLNRNDYFKMLEESNDCCKICKRKSNLVVDHCHKTNKVRGLLCQQCNKGLGNFEDNVEVLSEAIKYLLECSSNGESAKLIPSRQWDRYPPFQQVYFA